MTPDLSPTRTLIIDLSGPDLTPTEARWLRQHPVGGVCLFARNFTTPERTARLIRDIRDALGRDTLIATDQEGGAVLRRLDVPAPPTPQALGVLHDVQAAFHAGAIAARGLIDLGLNWNFAPSLDVNIDPLNPVIGERSFGTDSVWVSLLGVAWAQGSESAGVLSAVKHFPGHGDTHTDSHLALPVVDKPRAVLEAVEWLPFRAAVAAGLGSIMTAHILYPALDRHNPATLSPALLTGLLRQEWGYDGVVVTDALDMHAVADLHPDGRAAPLAIVAGADAALVCGHGDPEVTARHARALEAAWQSGALPEARLHEAVTRLETALNRFPGTPQPYSQPQREADERALDAWATRALSWTGERLRLDPARPVLLFAPTDTPLGGPYGDFLGGEALAETLTVALPHLQFCPVGADSATLQILLTRFPDAPALLATTGRWEVGADTRGLAQLLASRAAPALHLALWNPDAAGAVPLPAVVTHGFRLANLRALARALVKG